MGANESVDGHVTTLPQSTVAVVATGTAPPNVAVAVAEFAPGMTLVGDTVTEASEAPRTVKVPDFEMPPIVAVTVIVRSAGMLAALTVNTAVSPFMVAVAGTVAVVGSEFESATVIPAERGALVFR